ncbi:MAG: inorganic phosphate transporter, PiT family [Pseudonocardia sp.]|jgi:phosphate/sulfate permease
MNVPITVVAMVVTALALDFTNGFHDVANAMATSIATGALRPKVAVLIAGVLNLVGAFLSVQVAKAGVVALVSTFLAAGIYAAARPRPVTAHNVNDVPTAGEPVGASA